jgi:hypothetical protein
MLKPMYLPVHINIIFKVKTLSMFKIVSIYYHFDFK